jgi:predicted GIY-YIG superfamily endonuclease
MSEQTTLYKFYNENKELLYVGITSQKDNRWSQHKASKPWWKEHKYVVSDHYDTREEASAAEEQSIKLEKPKYNIKHNEGNLDFVVAAFNQNTYQGQSLLFELLSQRWLMGVGENNVHFCLIYETPKEFYADSNYWIERTFTFFFSGIDYHQTKTLLDRWLKTCAEFAYGANNTYDAKADKRYKDYVQDIGDPWEKFCCDYAQEVVDQRNSGQSSFMLPPWNLDLQIEDFNLLTLKGSNLES